MGAADRILTVQSVLPAKLRRERQGGRRTGLALSHDFRDLGICRIDFGAVRGRRGRCAGGPTPGDGLGS
jgi:hypothetical protein